MRRILVVVLVFCAACTSGSTTTTITTTTTPASPSLVPTLIGHTEGQAKASIRTNDYDPKRQHDWSRKKKGTVIHQSPEAGTELAPGATVAYVVSDGLPEVPR